MENNTLANALMPFGFFDERITDLRGLAPVALRDHPQAR